MTMTSARCRPLARLLAALVVLAPALGMAGGWVEDWRRSHPRWQGVHLILRTPEAAAELESRLPDLARAGANVLIVEVNYNFAYDSHPELRDATVIDKARAASLARACRRLNLRLIPQFSCLGHQSWAEHTFPLLTRYPELDETPGQFPGNKDIYCRSWCPRHPRVLEIVLPMLDELLNAFDADALHVGMDEVFLLASEHCGRCRGANPAELFAKAVTDLHTHLVTRRGREMLMWADRLLDAQATGYGEWEAARNGTHPAVDLIPRDIILCDWHYEPLARYPGKPADYLSVPHLLGKGFRVWPAGWKNVEAVQALAESSRRHATERMLGYLVTTWGAVKVADLAEWPPLRVGFAAPARQEP